MASEPAGLARQRPLALAQLPGIAQEAEALGERPVQAHQHGGGDHAEHHRTEQRLAGLLRQQPAAEGGGEQEQAELAGVREAGADPHRHPRGQARGPRQQRDEQALAQDEGGGKTGHRSRLPRERDGIDLHAHAREEQPQQHLAEGADVLLDLVAKLGLAQHHARHEGPDGRAEAGEVRHAGSAQHDQQRREHEELARAHGRHAAQEGPRQPLAGEVEPRHHGGRAPERQRELADGDLASAPGLAHEDEEGERREILEQEHGDGRAAVAAGELELLAELAHDDGGRRHGDGAADHDGRRRREPGGERGPRARRRRQRHLRKRERQHPGPLRQQLGQRELQAHREQQEDHAELGQQPRERGVGQPAERMRPHQQAHEEVAEHGGQAQRAEGREDDDGRPQQRHHLQQRMPFHPRPPSAEPLPVGRLDAVGPQRAQARRRPAAGAHRPLTAPAAGPARSGYRRTTSGRRAAAAW